MDDVTLDFLEVANRDENDSGNDGSDEYDFEDDDMVDGDLEAFETPIDVPSDEEGEDDGADEGTTPVSGALAQAKRLAKHNIVDEYIIFHQTISHLQNAEPQLYNALIAPISAQQQSELRRLLGVAEQRAKLAESRVLASTGGYKFTEAAVPSSFNFGA